jgi:hypothetical protein
VTTSSVGDAPERTLAPVSSINDIGHRCTIALQLTDVVITPTASMTSENHTIRVESGIDDASGNTTETAVDITFFVSAE